ncbi:MAG: hypothetical protein M1828_000106 [Chrysothrix sp. TS-e1954]|nr:MAG: hypothetical protein M1828_000106 [Chrysothrix sp. TS-e1954]
MNKSAVLQTQATIYRGVDRLCCKMRQIKMEGKAFNMRDQFFAWMLDFTSDYIFGTPFGILEDEALTNEWSATHARFAATFAFLKHQTWIMPLSLDMPDVALWVAPPLAPIVRLYKYFCNIAQKAVDDQEASEGEKIKPSDRETDNSHGSVTLHSGNLFERLIESDVEAEDKSSKIMAQIAMEIVAAGGNTTSRILMFATFHVLENVACKERLERELDEAIPDPEALPNLDLLETLSWLNAVLKEALRISALFTARMPRTAPESAMVYKDWVIPPKTTVSMTIADVLMDPDIYEEPNSFRPERWLDEDEAKLAQLNQHLVTFGSGSRQCIGINFAMGNLRAAMAALFRRFDFTLHDTSRRDIDATWGWFVGEPPKSSKGAFIKVKAVR